MNLFQDFKSIFFRKQGRFTQIDGLRALALLWAFSFHIILLFAEVLPRHETIEIFSRNQLTWLLHGHFSIDIFFIISGFLIGDLLIKEIEKTQCLNFSRFYLRRLMRLAPVYYAIMALLYLFTVVTAEGSIIISHAWTNFFYINNFIPFLNQFMPWTWSLAVEEQFYLLAPLIIFIIFVKKLNPIWSIITLILAGFIINITISQNAQIPLYYIVHPVLQTPTTDFYGYYDLMYNKFYTRYVALLLGVLLAYSIRQTWFNKLFSSNIFAMIVVIFVIGLMKLIFQQIDYEIATQPMENIFMATYRYWFAIGITLLIALAFSNSFIGQWLKKILSLNLWFPIAQLSYVAFLIQPVIIVLVMRQMYHGQHINFRDIIIIWTLSAFFIFIISIFFHLFIEKPWMNNRPK